MSAKILLIDIETKPFLVYTWGLYNQNIATNQIKEEWAILTYAAKWFGHDKIMSDTAEKDINDERLINGIWQLLDQADIVIAHNGDRFDIPKINAKMFKYKVKPPSPYHKIDTLKSLRASFALTSNRLDFVSKYLGSQGKLDTGGMKLWIDCLNGDPKAWEKMEFYNIQDVIELEKVYVAIRPWITNHPNLGLYNDKEHTVCPKCGGEHIHYRGYVKTGVSIFRRFQCKTCGGWGQVLPNLLPKHERERIGRNVRA